MTRLEKAEKWLALAEAEMQEFQERRKARGMTGAYEDLERGRFLAAAREELTAAQREALVETR